MDINQRIELLKLAQQAETNTSGASDTDAVIKRLKQYLDAIWSYSPSLN